MGQLTSFVQTVAGTHLYRGVRVGVAQEFLCSNQTETVTVFYVFGCFSFPYLFNKFRSQRSNLGLDDTHKMGRTRQAEGRERERDIWQRDRLGASGVVPVAVLCAYNHIFFSVFVGVRHRFVWHLLHAARTRIPRMLLPHAHLLVDLTFAGPYFSGIYFVKCYLYRIV